MPYVQVERNELRVEIPSIVLDGTTVMRQVLCRRMIQTHPYQNQPSSVSLYLLIEHYAVGPNDAEGKPTFGKRMSEQFPNIDRDFLLEANSSTIVDAQTGKTLCSRAEYEKSLQVAAENPNLGVDLPPALYNEDGSEKYFQGEDEFFYNVAKNVSVIVDDLQIQYINSAATNKKFDLKPV